MDKEIYDVLQKMEMRLKGIELNLHNINTHLDMYNITKKEKEEQTVKQEIKQPVVQTSVKEEAPINTQKEEQKPEEPEYVLPINYVEELEKEDISPVKEEIKETPVQEVKRIPDSIYNKIPETKKVSSVTDKDNLESFLGKNIMGIVASVLIFIGLGLVGVVVFPLLTDVIKFVLMALVSIVLTGTGFILTNRDEENKFNLSLLACGTGALYITALAGTLFFHLYNEIVLFMFIILWGFMLLYFSRYQSILFNIIGQFGTVVAVTLGIFNVNQVINTPSSLHQSFEYTLALIPVLLYAFIAEGVYAVYFKKQKTVNNTFLLIILTEVCTLIKPEYVDKWIYIVLFTIIAVLFMIISIMGNGYIQLISPILMSIGFVKAYGVRDTEIWNSGDMPVIAISLIFMLCYFCMAFFSIIKDSSDNSAEAICQKISVPFSLICMFVVANVCQIGKGLSILDIIGTGVFLLPLLFLVYKNEKQDFAPYIFAGIIIRILMCFCSIPFMFMSSKIQTGIIFDAVFFFTLPLVLERILEFTDNENNNILFKISVYSSAVSAVIFPLLIASMFDIKNGEMILSTIEIISMLIYFWMIRLFTNIDDKTEYILNNIFTGLSALVIYIFAREISSDISIGNIIAFIIQFMCLISFVVSYTEKEFEDKDLRVLSCIKYTGLTFILSSVFNSPLVMSFLMLLAALFFIVVGFKREIKGVRIYGLILSMLSVVKAVMIDLSYKGTVWRALGFIACGVLCFSISFIYNMIGKNNLFGNVKPSENNEYRGM